MAKRISQVVNCPRSIGKTFLFIFLIEHLKPTLFLPGFHEQQRITAAPSAAAPHSRQHEPGRSSPALPAAALALPAPARPV